MKLFLVFLLVAVASASRDITEERQHSLDVLTKLRQALPVFKAARDSMDEEASEVAQNASEILSGFLLEVLEAKLQSMQSMLDLEEETLAFGENFDKWCWESNIPALEGIMRWIGTDFSECITKLDKSVAKLVQNLYADSFMEASFINQNYGFFDVFEKRNIISNPQSIVDAIRKMTIDLSHDIPELGSIVDDFASDLHGTFPVYTECLQRRLIPRAVSIEKLKDETVRCAERLEESESSEKASEET